MASPAGRTGLPLLEAGDTERPSIRSGWLRRASVGRAAPVTVALVAMLIAIAVINPRTRTYVGATLLLSTLVPLALAALAQMFVMVVGDIDLGIGNFIGLVNAIAVVLLPKNLVVGVLALIGGVAGYVVMGIIVYQRRAPAIVVTLGASFVWLGLALLLLPTPGGTAPGYLVTALSLATPVVPYPIILFAGMIVVGGLILRRSRTGALIRGLGGSKASVRRSGMSVGWGVLCAYGLAGFFAVLAGLAITGVATSGDVGVGSGYTLTTIAGVVLGGGEFSGGRVSAAGAVLGAVTVGMVGAALSFVGISSNYDFAAEGILLLIFVSLRWARSQRSLA